MIYENLIERKDFSFLLLNSDPNDFSVQNVYISWEYYDRNYYDKMFILEDSQNRFRKYYHNLEFYMNMKELR